MKGLALSLVVAAVLVVGMLKYRGEAAKLLGMAPKPALFNTTPEPVAQTPEEKADKCRDACEQKNIVDNNEAALRSCREACDAAANGVAAGDAKGASRGKNKLVRGDLIKSVTLAPADHRLERAPERPITRTAR